MEPDLTLQETLEKVSKLKHPRVTEAYIRSRIALVDYLYHGTTTICVIQMANEFKFIGHSTPADPRNFETDIGRRYAYENAFRQIWTHEGYLLRERLSEDGAVDSIEAAMDRLDGEALAADGGSGGEALAADGGREPGA